MDFSSDGRLLACTDADGTIQLLELGGVAPKLRRELKGECRGFLAFSPKGSWFVADHGWQAVRLWKLNWPEEQPPEVYETRADWIVFSQNGLVLALKSGWDHSVIDVWDMSGVLPKAKAGLKGGPVARLAVSPDGTVVAASDPWMDIQLWDISQAKPKPLPGLHHRQFISSLAFAPKGKVLACGGHLFTQIWDLSGPEPRVQAKLFLPGSDDWVSFSPNADRIVTARTGGKVIVWDVINEKELWRWQLPGPVLKVMFTPDGRHLATLNSNGTIYILRLEDRTGKKYSP